MSDYKYIGKNITFSDIDEKITGKMKYVGDNQDDDLLHVKLILSEVARGKIKKIITNRAEEVKGVVKIYTAQNTPQKRYNAFHWYEGKKSLEDERILSDEARFYGDRIAAVVAESKKAAKKAARLIEVEYEEVFKIPQNKYKVSCKGVEIDVYDVLKSFDVTCPATQHAIKKLLKSGKRGYKDNKQDLNEAIQSIKRAIELI